MSMNDEQLKKLLTPEPNTCPRCGGGIPTDLHRGEYPGAISRIAKGVYICSRCGTAEAMESFAFGRPLPTEQWLVPPS